MNRYAEPADAPAAGLIIAIPLAGGRKARIQLPEDGLRENEAERVARVVRAYSELPPKEERENDD